MGIYILHPFVLDIANYFDLLGRRPNAFVGTLLVTTVVVLGAWGATVALANVPVMKKTISLKRPWSHRRWREDCLLRLHSLAMFHSMIRLCDVDNTNNPVAEADFVAVSGVTRIYDGHRTWLISWSD